MRDHCQEAVGAALAAGAEYADARAVVDRQQHVATKNGRVETLVDGDSEGIGVRVLVGGAWGFACSYRLDLDGAHDAAARATSFAKAAPSSNDRALAPIEPATGSYATQVGRDPFDVPLAEKIELCLRAEEAARHPGVKVTSASARAQSQRKHLVTSNGTDVEQHIVECGAGLDALAAGDGRFQQRSYPSAFGGSSAQGGWEHVEGLRLEEVAPQLGEEAAALLRADECPQAVTTVVINSEQVALQVHESVGHPTELDRIYGTEAAYAGTSFLSPADLGALRYGSDLMNVTADSTTPAGLGTFGWDDEGVTARREPVVAGGVLASFLTSRETAAQLGAGAGGSMRAETWNRMPLVRMTNLHLEAGEAGSVEDLIADVDEGIYLSTNRSWSIDDKRLNFQFGTQIAWEIKNGKLGRMFRDAIYTGITPRFWGSLDALGGPETWVLYGLTNCGKGQPGQSAHVSHGAPAARFRNVQVGVRP
jgi:TldD protein